MKIFILISSLIPLISLAQVPFEETFSEEFYLKSFLQWPHPMQNSRGPANTDDAYMQAAIEESQEINDYSNVLDGNKECSYCATKLEEEGLKKFQRTHSGLSYSTCSSSGNADGYKILTLIDCTGGGGRYPGSFKFSDGPGHPYLSNVSSPYSGNGKPVRNIEFVSRNEAFNGTYIYLEDLAGGPDSHDVKSMMFILPRKFIPSVRTMGNEVHVTLTTGEEVTFDKISHAIISGVLVEGPIDLTTDRFKRTPPNVHYKGAGISLRVDHRYEFPSVGAAQVVVEQGNSSCKIPRGNIFDSDGYLKSQSDEELVNVINTSCRGVHFSL